MKKVKPQIYILAEIECCEEDCTSTFATRLPVYTHSMAGFAMPCVVAPPRGWSVTNTDLKRALQPIQEVDYYCLRHKPTRRSR